LFCVVGWCLLAGVVLPPGNVNFRKRFTILLLHLPLTHFLTHFLTHSLETMYLLLVTVVVAFFTVSYAQTCPQTVVSTTVDCTNYAVGRGQLGMSGIQLVDAFNQPVQLRGISSNGLQHSPYCATKESISHFVTNWGINVYRAAIYVDEWEDGYTVNSVFLDDFIENVVQWCKELGIYVIIDWHIIGDPNAYLDDWYHGTSGLAVDFFEKYSLMYKDETHVLYEIANEPFNVGWESLVWYHNLIIDTIRANDPHAIIIAGTPNYSQEIDKAFATPVTNSHNVFYAFHFYAADHGHLLPLFEEYVVKLPLFVSAWGISDFDGDGPYNISVANEYLTKCSGVLGTAVSWLQWSLTDIDETASLLEPNSCRYLF
jgi:endoglucanase